MRDFFKKELFKPLEMKATHLISLEESFKIQDSPYSTPYPEKYFVVPNNTTKPTFNVIETKYLSIQIFL